MKKNMWNLMIYLCVLTETSGFTAWNPGDLHHITAWGDLIGLICRKKKTFKFNWLDINTY